MSAVANPGVRLPQASLGVLAGVLLLAPLPLGLRSAELTSLAVAGIGLLLVSKQLGISRLHLPLFLLAVVLAGTVIGYMRGDAVVPFQFARAALFPCLLPWLLYERWSSGFFGNFERLLPFLAAGACLSAVLYFGFESSFYNSTLNIPYADAPYKRLYVYPTYLFLVLLFDAIRGNRSSQFVYAVLLAVSGSKIIVACMAAIYLYFGLRKASSGRLVLLVAGLAALLVVAYLGGLFNRVEDLLNHGDPWRIQEPIAAAKRLADPVRFLIGNGGGVAYWEGQNGLAEIQGDDSRAVVNSMFDVHNGFMTLALRFGVPLTVLYVFALVKSVPKTDGGWLLVALIVANILLSHGPVETVEAVGLALGIRLLQHRTMPACHVESGRV